MAEYEPKRKDEEQAKTLVQIASIIGLVIYVSFAISKEVELSLVVLAIFGAGIVGVNGIKSLIQFIFRVGNDK